MQVANAAHGMLSVIHVGAAQLNDKINLFRDEAKFPEVFRSEQGPPLFALAVDPTLFCLAVTQCHKH